MIVEDQLDGRMARIGGVEELEEFDEFARAVAVLDESVDLAGDEIDAGQQADRAVAPVLVVAREGRMPAGFGRQVRGGRGDRLNAGLLIVGDDRHRIARFLFRRRRLLDELHFASDAQNLRHLLLELRIAAFQVVADLVGSMLARVASQEPRRPQLVRRAQSVLRLAAGQRDQPCLGLGGDRRLLAGPRPIIERRQRTVDQRPLDTALNGLMVCAYGPSHRKKGWLVPIDQQHPRPLDPARRLRS